jgi:hypothetical protein
VTVSRELSKYKLHLVGVHEVRRAQNLQENIYFSAEREIRTMDWVQVFCA